MPKLIKYLLILPLIFYLSCPKEDNQTLGESKSSLSKVKGEESILISATPYFEKVTSVDGTETFKQLGYLPAYTAVTLLEGQKYEFKIGANNFKVGPARLKDGKEVYLSLWYLLPQQQLAVIKTDVAKVFKGLSPVDVTNYQLDYLTIIGIVPVEDSPENKLKRQRMVYYNAEKEYYLGTWNTYYINSEDITTNDEDVELARNLNELSKVNISQWSTILEETLKLTPNSIFASYARKLIDDLKQLSTQPKVNYPGRAKVIKNLVKVYKEPLTISSVLLALQQGDIVEITARTAEKFDVASRFDYWYEITKNNAKGWVFGAYLEEIFEE